MASALHSSRTGRRTRPELSGLRTWSRRFVSHRAKEAGYGLFFASVFLLCQAPANALAIDDIRVLSRLGEPLVAEVAVSPAAGEALNRACFSTRRSAGGLPDIGTVRLSLTRSVDSMVLRIAGSQPVREPMSEFVLQVKCAGVATIVKSFLVMVDPPTMTAGVSAPPGIAAQTQPAPGQFETQAASQSASRASTLPERALPRRLTTTTSSGTPIQPGSQYRVRPGDTLSTIASRVAGRPDWSVWPIAQHIYATNTGAFLLGNPNVIAEGAVVFVPRLADVNMGRTAADVRVSAKADPVRRVAQAETPTIAAPATEPAAPASSRQPAAAPTNTAAQATAAAATVDKTTVAPATPAPIVPITEAAPLPSMQLTINLLDESLMKIELRGQGLPVTATIVTADPAPQTPIGSTPDPQGSPERPNDATTDSRAVIQPIQPAAADGQLNWLWVAVGILTSLLIGGLAAVSLFRRNLRHEYEHDVRDAVQRQIQSDRLRARREQAPPASATSMAETPNVAAAVAAAATDLTDISGTVETLQPASDQTVEMSTVEDIDFDMTPQDEPARTGSPETLEMPGIANDLDLELTPDTGKTGQHEVDYDLLEAAYSEDYQSEFVNADSKAATDSDAAASSNDERYYHLENRDPTDEAPLPIELGDDEMGSDGNGVSDGKVVRFRR